MHHQICFAKFPFFFLAFLLSLHIPNNEATDEKEEKFLVDMVKRSGLGLKKDVLGQLESSEVYIQKMIKIEENPALRQENDANRTGASQKKKSGLKVKLCSPFKNFGKTYKIIKNLSTGHSSMKEAISAMLRTLENDSEMTEKLLKEKCNDRKANGNEQEALLEDMTKNPTKVVTKYVRLLSCNLRGNCNAAYQMETCSIIANVGSPEFAERVKGLVVVAEEKQHAKGGGIKNYFHKFNRVN